MKISPSKLFSLFFILSFVTITQTWADPDVNPQPGASPNPALAPEKKIPYTTLSSDEREALDRGEISTAQYIIGGVIGTVFGLGIGQAVQQRYVPTGLIMTVGEAGSITMMVAGAAQCVDSAVATSFAAPNSNNTQNCSNTLLGVGVGLYVGLRIWEIIDVWATPPSINHRYQELKEHVDRTASIGVVPAVASGQTQIDGALLAYQLRF